jgi:hypothetical protein
MPVSSVSATSAKSLAGGGGGGHAVGGAVADGVGVPFQTRPRWCSGCSGCPRRSRNPVWAECSCWPDGAKVTRRRGKTSTKARGSTNQGSEEAGQQTFFHGRQV